MQFICYPPCGTCRKARAWLDARGVSYAFRDIKKDPPKKAELEDWLAQSGGDVGRFWNTSGQAYRALGLSGRRRDMTRDEQLALLATDGMLVKRPILAGDGFALVGFEEAAWAARFPAK